MIEALRTTQHSTLGNFLDYKLLHQTRTKKSLLPIVGKAFIFLFGTVSKADLNAIRNNMAVLGETQKDIAHVLVF